MVHHIDVVVVKGAKRLEVLAPCKNHKVDGGSQGDQIEWHFHNRNRTAVVVAIGKFGRHSRARCTVPANHALHMTEPIDPQPVAFAVASVTVKPGGRKVLAGTIKTKLLPRTYKYSILGNGKVVLDPEIEIEN